MIGITQKFVCLNISTAHPSVKIVDGTHSPVLGNGVVQTTPFWPLLMSFMFYDFLLLFCLSVTLLNKITAK